MGFAVRPLRLKPKISTAADVIRCYCAGKDVLDLGFLNHSSSSADKPGWLHREVLSVAKRSVGVDYVKDGVERMRERGLEAVCADVTEPIPIAEKFDVIIAFHVIEHLTNFDGFFRNCQRLLKRDGRLIIASPNPFYIEGVHYLALKGRVLVNPEHTCWVDPQCLSQLGGRYGFEVVDTLLVKKSWRLRWFITGGERNRYDILSETWVGDTAAKRAARFFSGLLFHIVYAPVKVASLGFTAWLSHSDYVAVLRRMDDSP